MRGDVHYTDDERGFPGPFGSNPGGTFSGIDTVSRGSNDRLLAAVSGAVPAGSRVRLNGQLAYTQHRRHAGELVRPGTSLFDTASRRTVGRAQADVTFQPSLQAIGWRANCSSSARRARSSSPSSRRSSGRADLGGYLRRGPMEPREPQVFVTAGLRVDRIARQDLDGNPRWLFPRPDFPDDVVTSVNPKVAVAWFVRSVGRIVHQAPRGGRHGHSST